MTIGPVTLSYRYRRGKSLRPKEKTFVYPDVETTSPRRRQETTTLRLYTATDEGTGTSK